MQELFQADGQFIYLICVQILVLSHPKNIQNVFQKGIKLIFKDKVKNEIRNMLPEDLGKSCEASHTSSKNPSLPKPQH